MWVLPLLVVLHLNFELVFGYAIESNQSWPTEYHFSGEEINLIGGVVKPFEIWYSKQHNKSRIDYYGGLLRTIYHSSLEGGHKVTKKYMYHTESDEAENPLIKCEITTTRSMRRNFEGFLPNLNHFNFDGHSYHSGKDVSVWKYNIQVPDMVDYRETQYVAQQEDNVVIPVQMEKKSFDTGNGGLKTHLIKNYYSYHNDIQDEVFAVDESKCTEHHTLDVEWAHISLDPHIEIDVEMAFDAYKTHHNREYEEAEHEMRKHIYLKNWKLVKEHNNQNLGYKLTMNQFADRTESELRYLAASRFTKPVVGTHEFPHTAEKLEEIVAELPKELDLRSEGFVSPVRNQGQCGSCWAFASTSAVESAVAKSIDGLMVDLSEQSLMDCAWNYESSGCKGSEDIGAVFKYMEKYGVPTVANYGPYLEVDGECKIRNMTDVYKIRGHVPVTPYSSNALKAALFSTGPVTVLINTTPKFHFYSSGVFYDPECHPKELTHAVTAVGYGYRYGDLYWILKNSWGEGWGQDGYMLILDKDNNCGVLTSPVYPLV